jgi:hypothetical protein
VGGGGGRRWAAVAVGRAHHDGHEHAQRGGGGGLLGLRVARGLHVARRGQRGGVPQRQLVRVGQALRGAEGTYNFVIRTGVT